MISEAEAVRSLLARAGEDVAPVAVDPVEAVLRRAGARRRRLRAAASGGAVLVLTAGVLVALAMRSPAPSSGPASNLPSLTDRTLWDISEGMAISGGDPAASQRVAVGPIPYNRANALNGSGGPAKPLVYVIEIVGHFTCGGCGGAPPSSSHRGTGAPTFYKVENSTLDAATLETLSAGVGPRLLALSSVGKPFNLPAPPKPDNLWPLPELGRSVGVTLRWSGPNGAVLALSPLGGPSSLAWNGGHRIDFALDWIDVGDGRHETRGEMRGVVTYDNVGIPYDASEGTILLRSQGGLRVSVIPASSTPLPNPLQSEGSSVRGTTLPHG
jgi:hypothetical protein